MKVLLVHQHFSHPGEGGAIRSYSLARFFINGGHSVDVITRKNGIDKPVVLDLEGIKIHYLPVNYSNDMNFIKRIPAYLKFVFKSLLYFRKLSDRKFDLNYCISTPLTSGLIGLWFRFRYKIPYIFEVGDLWPDAPIALKAIRFTPTKKFLIWLEKIIYSRAEKIIGLSPPIVEKIRQRTQTPVAYVPNFSDNDFYKPADYKSDSFHVSYIGTLGRANQLEYMLMAARECEIKNIPVHFNIMGAGARKLPLIVEANRLNLKNITFHSFGNRQAVKDLLEKSDAAYISYKKLPVLETGSPNKFFDALAAGKLIILNFRGWLNKYLVEYQCGYSYDPEKPEEFVENLLPHIQDRNLLIERQKNSRRLAEEEFDMSKWQSLFLFEINDIQS